VSGERIGDSAETSPNLGLIPKIQDEAADRPGALRDASGPDGSREMERVCRHWIKGQQLVPESELTDELCQAFVGAGAFEQRGGTLESLHSSSVAEPAISAYIVWRLRDANLR